MMFVIDKKKSGKDEPAIQWQTARYDLGSDQQQVVREEEEEEEESGEEEKNQYNHHNRFGVMDDLGATSRQVGGAAVAGAAAAGCLCLGTGAMLAAGAAVAYAASQRDGSVGEACRVGGDKFLDAGEQLVVKGGGAILHQLEKTKTTVSRGRNATASTSSTHDDNKTVTDEEEKVSLLGSKEEEEEKMQKQKEGQWQQQQEEEQKYEREEAIREALRAGGHCIVDASERIRAKGSAVLRKTTAVLKPKNKSDEQQQQKQPKFHAGNTMTAAAVTKFGSVATHCANSFL